MIFLKSITNVFRSRAKSVLFFFLIVLVTTILSLSLGVCVSTQEFLDLCDESYTTVAILEYMGPDYPHIEIYDQHMQDVLADFDSSIIEDNKNVLKWDRVSRALGYIHGYGRADMARPLKKQGVLIVKDMYKYKEVGYTGTIVDPISSDLLAGLAVFVITDESTKDIKVEKDRIYAVQGEFVIGRTTYKDIHPMPFKHDAALAIGVTDGENYMITDVTEEYEANQGLLDDNMYTKIANTYNVIKSSVNVFAVKDIQFIYDFNQEQLYLTEGRVFTEEEYEKGSAVCIMSSYFANHHGLSVGDKIPISQAVTEGACYYESYYEDAGFAHTDTYEIVGLTNNNQDCNFNVYIPKNPDINYNVNQIGYTVGGAILDNDGASAFYQEVVDNLPDRMLLSIYDQGYSATTEPFKDILRISKIIVAVSLMAGAAILILFGFIFVYRQRDVGDIMIKLGTGKVRACSYFLYGSGAISVVAATLGIWLSYILSGYVMQLVKSIASNYVLSDVRFSNGNLSIIKELVYEGHINHSYLFYVGGAVILAAMASCLFFTLMSLKKKQKKKRKKQVVMRHKGHTSTIGIPSIKYSVLSVIRGKGRAWIIPIFAVSVVLLLSQLVNTAMGYQRQLDTLKANAVIDGQFVNIEGKVVDKVPVDSYQIRDLNDSGFVKDIYVSEASHYKYKGRYDQETNEFLAVPFNMPDRRFIWALETFLATIAMGPEIIYTNSIEASPEFFYSTCIQVEYLDGYDGTILGEPVDGVPCCIVSNAFMDEFDVQLGDVIRVFELGYYYDIYTFEYDLEMKVVGSYVKQGTKDNIYCQLGVFIDPEIVLGAPLDDRKKLEDYYFDSACYTVVDARKLGEFKSFLYDYGFSSGTRIGKYRSFMVLEDKKFNSTVDMLTQQIRYISVLYPVLYTLVGIVSIIVSYLLVVSRRKEFAIMRGLGAHKRVTFMSFFIEQVLMCLIGVAVGLAVCLLVYGTFHILQLYLVAGFVVCYCIGCAISISIMSNTTVLAILRYED